MVEKGNIIVWTAQPRCIEIILETGPEWQWSIDFDAFIRPRSSTAGTWAISQKYGLDEEDIDAAAYCRVCAII